MVALSLCNSDATLLLGLCSICLLMEDDTSKQLNSSLGLSVGHVYVSINHEQEKNTSYEARHMSVRCRGPCYVIVITKSLKFFSEWGRDSVIRPNLILYFFKVEPCTASQCIRHQILTNWVPLGP